MTFDFGFRIKNPRLASPLALAFVGDAVWEIYVRSRIIEDRPDMPVSRLHKEAVRFVRAEGQCIALNAVLDSLSEDEEAAYKRGRNANPHTAAKHAAIGDYRRATGFEALLGYVYMTNAHERLSDLMKTGYDAVLNS